MASEFTIILEEFTDDISAIRDLVSALASPSHAAKTRIAAANSSTLLVAATFEEYVREIARAYARAVVRAAPSFDKLPKNLVGTAWKRVMDGIGKLKVDGGDKLGDIINLAQARFSTIYEFCRGDLEQDIYQELIHNENNMRPRQINELFKLSGLNDICELCSHRQCLLDLFGETENGKAHGKMMRSLEDFFERRNQIAHSLSKGQSSSPDQVSTDVELLLTIGKALCEVLEYKFPASTPTPTTVPISS